MANYLYHPGDRVLVRPDLEVQTDYKMLSGKNSGLAWWALERMKKYAGKEIIIQEIDFRGVYRANVLFDLVWTDEMLLPLTNECVCDSLL